MENQITRFIILGCGHTGSTLISGIFNISGFGTIGLSRSVFESRQINDLCNLLFERKLEPCLEYTIDHFLDRLEKKTGGKWCIKDPLLSFTIEQIYPRISQPIKVVFNYRDPRNTVTHLLKEIRKWRPDLSDDQARKTAEMQWYKSNTAAIEFLEKNDNLPYLMVNYDELVNGKLFDIIDRFVGKEMNYEFIKPSKRRSPVSAVSRELLCLYDELNDMSQQNHEIILENMSKINRRIWIRHKLQYKWYMGKLIFKDIILRNMYKGMDDPRLPYIRPPFPNHDKMVKNSGGAKDSARTEL